MLFASPQAASRPGFCANFIMKELIVVIAILFATKYVNAQQPGDSAREKTGKGPVSGSKEMKSYLSMQGGQMILVDNDKVGRMKKDMTMKNGTLVKTDGTVKTKDGRSFQLKEGNRVYMNGFIEGLEKSPID